MQNGTTARLRQITMRWRLLVAALCVIIVPMVSYVAVPAYWHAQNYNGVIGDEPHFLMITDSLARDHDLSLANNYAHGSAASIEIGSRLDPEDVSHLVNGHPVLGIGLPLLLAIPYLVDGVSGAKFFLAFMIGLTLPLIVLTTILPIIKRIRWAVLVTLSFVCALPFLAASNQIYSDLVAGLVILHSTALVVGMYTRRQLAPHNALLLGIELAFLPWLYYRYIPPALIILGGAVLIIRSLPRDRRLNLALAVSSLLVLTAFVGLAFYNYYSFGNLLGVFRASTVSYDFTNIIMVFAGLHWDSLHGMFIQQPLLWFALLGIAPFARANWRAAVLVGLVYMSCVVPASLHPNWYGGQSFGGRYMWDAIGLWIFPFAYAAARFQNRAGRVLLLAVCALNLVWQGALVTIWLPHNRFLMNEGYGLPIWASGDLYTPLLRLTLRQQYLLPAFRNPAYYAEHIPNYLVVGASALLLISGAYLAGVLQDKRLLGALWGVFALVTLASLWLYAPSIKPMVFKASQLPGFVGVNEGGERVAVPSKPGYLAFGPYIHVFPDRKYNVTLTYATGSQVYANYDLALDYGKVIIANQKLPSAATNGGIYLQRIVVPRMSDGSETPSVFEFRIFYKGRGRLRIQQLEISPL